LQQYAEEAVAEKMKCSKNAFNNLWGNKMPMAGFQRERDKRLCVESRTAPADL
jgi:hypothetical protein